MIGINDYQHPRVDKLRYAVNDARSVERALLTLGWRADRIVTLVSERREPVRRPRYGRERLGVGRRLVRCDLLRA
ncbi:MAG: hypothetical protein Q8S13_01325 [Dehalococcoidia bacterium]|nr:hypothetical protein [Dehalococcoidia bacterium]